MENGIKKIEKIKEEIREMYGKKILSWVANSKIIETCVVLFFLGLIIGCTPNVKISVKKIADGIAYTTSSIVILWIFITQTIQVVIRPDINVTDHQIHVQIKSNLAKILREIELRKDNAWKSTMKVSDEDLENEKLALEAALLEHSRFYR